MSGEPDGKKLGREQLNGADTALFGLCCAWLAPLVGQNDDLKRTTQENEP